MRALRWPDAFPAGDLALLRASGAPSARGLRDLAEGWRPWRAYAAMYLWESQLSALHNPGIGELS
jgi:AraC family transcriptional regulator of adaptative response / DNA-3-methyladenine glycosylase II